MQLNHLLCLSLYLLNSILLSYDNDTHEQMFTVFDHYLLCYALYFCSVKCGWKLDEKSF